MTLDQFVADNTRSWERLDELVRRAGRRTSKLSSDELDELLRLYRLASTHLSYASTNFSDPGLSARLSTLVSRSAALIYGSRPHTFREFGRFFAVTLPAAIWYSRRFLAVSAFFLFAPAVIFGVWLANSPKAIDATAPAALRQAYVDHDFSSYYSSQPSAQFASKVFTNNIVVSGEAFALGIVLCVPAAVVLAENGANLGVAAGLFSAAGKTPQFYGLILPHGLIELTSVAMAGAAGIRIGWSIISPGDRSRYDSLVEEARRAVVLVIGTIFTLAVAGTIEGFVTGSGLPTALRVGIGVTVEAAFVAYVVVLGRRAAARGLTGVLGEGKTGWADRTDLPVPV